MGTRMAGRMWLLGGVLVIALLVVATYLLAIKPVYDDKALKESQVEDMNIQVSKLKSEFADLKKKSANLATYTAELAAKKKQLPDKYDIPGYLRLMQDSDGAVKVDNNSIGVSTPIAVTGTSVLVGVPMTLSANGTAPALSKWYDRLLRQQTRATLINSVTLQGSGNTWTTGVTVTLFCSKTTDNDCVLPTA